MRAGAPHFRPLRAAWPSHGCRAMENTNPYVRTAAWLASLAAAGGDGRTAEGYLLGILAWYVTFGGTLLADEAETQPRPIG